MRHIRKRDRQIHGSCYPELYYPHVYLIDAGYKNFFSQQADFCEPKGYIPMEDAAYADECCGQLRRFREGFSRSTSIAPCRLRRRSRSLLASPTFTLSDHGAALAHKADGATEDILMSPPSTNQRLLSPPGSKLIRSLTL
jgi:M-phase inducer tyrosine phosphatase